MAKLKYIIGALVVIAWIGFYVHRDYTWQNSVISTMKTGGWWVGREQSNTIYPTRPWTFFKQPVADLILIRNRQEIVPNIIQAEEYFAVNPLDDRSDQFDEFFLTDCKTHRVAIVDPLSISKVENLKWSEGPNDTLFSAMCEPRAMLGWYSLSPPFKQLVLPRACHSDSDRKSEKDDASCVLDYQAPLPTWDQDGRFATKRNCEDMRVASIQGAREKDKEMRQSNDRREGLMWSRLKKEEASECVASDDPRLIDSTLYKESADALAMSAHALTCGNYLNFTDKEKAELAYGYFEGVQAELDKDEHADILVPTSDPGHPIWWVLPVGLGENPFVGLGHKLKRYCQFEGNGPKGLLEALLSIAYKKDGFPAFGISFDRRKTDPWKNILGGEDSSVSCSAYTASSAETRQAIIDGYYLGSQALRVRLKSPKEAFRIAWPSKSSPQTVRIEVDRGCLKDKDAKLRDVLYVRTTEMAVMESAKPTSRINKKRDNSTPSS